MLETIAVILCCAGLVLFTGGTAGILRMPDVYTRLHMAGKLDTLGTLTLLAGLIVSCWLPHHAVSLLTQLKILLLWAFVLVTSPTASHAMANAGMRAGVEPWLRPDPTRRHA
ncbi:cation:proton antiporter [Solidesulfovibrio sp.]